MQVMSSWVSSKPRHIGTKQFALNTKRHSRSGMGQLALQGIHTSYSIENIVSLTTDIRMLHYLPFVVLGISGGKKESL